MSFPADHSYHQPISRFRLPGAESDPVCVNCGSVLTNDESLNSDPLWPLCEEHQKEKEATDG